MRKRASRSRGGSATRWLARGVVAFLALAAGVALIGYRNARADPVVRRMTVKLPGWPAGAGPVRVVLLSDIHIGSPATDGARLR